MKQSDPYTVRLLCGMDPLVEQNDNLDVEVIFADGTRWGATFFTWSNLQSLLQKYEQTGECRNGLYLWASNMIIVREITPEIVSATIAGLLEDCEFSHAFQRLQPIESSMAETRTKENLEQSRSQY